MKQLSILSICFALCICSIQLVAQSDYLVFERAYEKYIQEQHQESIQLLEEHLQKKETNEQAILLKPSSHFLQLSRKPYNRGLLILLQLKQNPDFFIHPRLLAFSPKEWVRQLGSQSYLNLWQKAHQALTHQQNNHLLQKRLADDMALAGFTALQLGNTLNAVTYFEVVLQLNKDNQEAQLGLIMCAFAQNQFDKAQQMLSDFSSKFPDNHFAELCSAEIYLSLEYFDRAAKSLDIFLGHLPTHSSFLTFHHYDLLLQAGKTKMFLQNYTVAEQYFSEAIEHNSNEIAPFIARAEARAYLLKLQEAENDLAIARSLDSKNSQVFFMLGYIRMLEWQNEDALAYFSKAIELEKDVKEFYIHRSSVKSVLGDIEGAIEDLDQVIQMDKKADKSFAVRAYLKSRKGDLKGALADYNQAVTLAPNNASHFIGRAAVKDELEMSESYLDDLDRAISLNPQNYYPYHAKGAWYQRNKENDKALEAYTQAIQIAPDMADIYLDRGSIHLAKGNPKGALQDLDTVISLEPKNGQAYFLQGILYFLLEKNLKACASMYKAKSLGFEEAEESLTSMCE